MDEQTAIEQLRYWFSLVAAREPEKGIAAILGRVRAKSADPADWPALLAEAVDGVAIRTTKRLALYNQCKNYPSQPS